MPYSGVITSHQKGRTVSNQEDSVVYVGRKHWIAYARSIVGNGVVSIILVGLVQEFATSGVGTATAVVFLLAILNIARRFLYLMSVSWTVTTEGLHIKRGFLPWKKQSVFDPKEHVYDAQYTRSAIGHFLHYGTVSYRRTEGTTSGTVEPLMAYPRRLVTMIIGRDPMTGKAVETAQGDSVRPATPAEAVAPEAATPVANSAPPGDGSVAEELERLASLLEKGAISEEEYATLKARVIGA